MTDLLLRQAHASRAGAQGDDDYDVIGAGGLEAASEAARSSVLGKQKLG
jgi:hypothetical protein